MIDHFPNDFPPLTLGVQRALCAISQRYPEKLVPAVASVYYAFWADGNSKVIQPEIFGPILEKVLGKEKTHEIIKDVCCSLWPERSYSILIAMTVHHIRHQEPIERKYRSRVQVRCLRPSLV